MLNSCQHHLLSRRLFFRVALQGCYIGWVHPLKCLLASPLLPPRLSLAHGQGNVGLVKGLGRTMR